jgi:hypothetical protein
VVGLRDTVEYQRWREQRAVELVGPYATKTAGAFVSSAQRRTTDGWIYGGRDAFCFFADNPVELAYLSPPGRIDQRTLLIAYQDCSAPKVVSAPGTPNLIIDFGDGREFAGAKAGMEHLLRLWQMWAGGSADPTLWKQTAELSGMPFYKRPGRIPSNPGRTALGAILGLMTSIALIINAATGALDSINTSLSATVVFILAACGLLLLVGRWQPNITAGLIAPTLPGALPITP